MANVRIALMDFKEKENRLDDFKYNVIPCLRNEIQSKSIVITDHDFDDIITDKSQLFNKACTKIIFKDYLENHKMKVSELQLILNDLYESFLLKQKKTKKSSTKSLSRKTMVEAVTEKNVSKKVVSDKLNTPISQTNASKKVVSNDDGVKVANAKKAVSNSAKLNTPISQTNVSKKVVSNDDGVKVATAKKVVYNSAKLNTPISQTNVSKKVVSNDDGVKVAIAKKFVSNIDDGIDKTITTPISSKTKVSKNSQNAITYCISLFEDYVSKSSCKFTFLTIRCYCNFLSCRSAVIFIFFGVITLYQRYGVDISYINNILC